MANLKNWFQIHMYRYFTAQKVNLLIIGGWPQFETPKWHLLLGIFNVIFNGIEVIGEFSFIFYNQGSIDLETTLNCIGPNMTKLSSTIKLAFIIWKRKEFYKLLKQLSDFSEHYFEAKEIEICQNYAKKSFVMCVVLSIFAQMTGVIFVIIPLFIGIQNIVNGEDWGRPLPFLAKYAWSYDNLLPYIFTFIWQTYANVWTSFSVSGLDGLFIGICFYITVELQCFQVRIRRVIKNLQSNENTTYVLSKNSNRSLYFDLEKFIHDHNVTLELTDKVADLTQEIIMIHFITAAVTICVNCVNFTISGAGQKSVYIFCISTLLTQAFIYCYGGDLVLQSVREMKLYPIFLTKLCCTANRIMNLL